MAPGASAVELLSPVTNLTNRATGTQWEVAQPPNDAISALEFAPESSKLIVSSWDKNVHLYDVGVDGAEETNLLKSYEFRAPVLDVCFGANDDEAFAGGLDHQVIRYI